MLDSASMVQPAVKDSFLDLEKHRQRLEDHVDNLRKSLQHWQTWEADYEGLKEEILAANPKPDRVQLLVLCRKYEGYLVKGKEIEEIVGVTTQRTSEQVINLLERRIDYVQKNVKTFLKQIETVDDKIAAAAVVSDPQVLNDEGLPIVEIIEELDEAGNVTSGRAVTPGSTRPQLLEILEKAGIKDLPNSNAPEAESLPSKVVDGVINGGRIEEEDRDRRSKDVNDGRRGVKEEDWIRRSEGANGSRRVEADDPEGQHEKINAGGRGVEERRSERGSKVNGQGRIGHPPLTPPNTEVKHVDGLDIETRHASPKTDKGDDVQERNPESQSTVKKDVRFAEDTKPGPEPQKSQTAQRVEKIMEAARRQPEPMTEPPVVPADETEEDAALRQEMLEYAMSEVGHIVAELDLEEGSDWSDVGEEGETSSDDEEDEYGRSKKSVLSDDYRQQMEELEQRVGIQMQNIGKNPKDHETANEGVGVVKISSHDGGGALNGTANNHKAERENGSKKSVRFSESLDISPDPQSYNASKSSSKKATPEEAPINNIIERFTPNRSEASAPKPPKKLSRFKTGRAVPSTTTVDSTHSSSISRDVTSSSQLPAPSKSQFRPAPHPFAPATDLSRTVPTGPEGKILESKLIERDIPASASISEPDEFNSQLIYQEVATEYHRRRNQMIQREGGFLKEVEEEVESYEDGEGGDTKKLSRFKAARLGML